MLKNKLSSVANFAMTFFGKVVLEFIWLLCSVSLGMYLVATVAHIDLSPIVQTYSSWLVAVLFNAAMARYVVAYGLDWIDRELDKGLAERNSMIATIKTSFQLAAARMFKHDEQN